MACYELIYILRPDVSTTQVDSAAEKITKFITDKGGKVASTEQWGLRTLAYKIRKHRKGYYTMLNLDMPGDIINPLEHMLKLNEDVIRFMTVKVEQLEEGPSIIMRKRKDESFESAEA